MPPKGPKMLNIANRAVWLVPSIADIKKPTAAEINAGVNITAMITAANYQFGVTGNGVIADPGLDAKIESDSPGLPKVEVKFDAFRFKNALDDILWTILNGAGIFTHAVERIGQIGDGEDQRTTLVKAADVVSVASVISHEQIPMSPATVGFEKFTQPFSVQEFSARSVVTGI